MAQNEPPRRSEIPQPPFSSFSSANVEFSVNPDRRLVVVKFEGSLAVQEIAKYVESLVADPKFDPAFSEITDLRGVQHFDLEANDFLTLADQIDPFSLTAKRAFVVRTSLQNQAARMHKFLRPHRTIEIFESVGAGRRMAWLVRREWVCAESYWLLFPFGRS